MSAISPPHSWAKFGIRPELASAVSGAVVQMQRILSSAAHPLDDDHYRSSAVAGVIATTTQASAFDLQHYAKSQLAAIRADGAAAPSVDALASFDRVLRAVVDDNGPTPQVGATPSGSVEIQWLVDGNLLSALFDATGDADVLAVDQNNEVLLDVEITNGSLSEGVRAAIGELLKSMSDRIVARPTSWSSRGEWR